MNSIEKYTERIFEDIKRIYEYGCEYCESRELMSLLIVNGKAFIKLLRK